MLPRAVPGPAKSNDPLVGRTLAGKFLISGLLGTGSMGRVYRAQHTALDKIIAVKVLNDIGTKDATIAARFKSEARAASRLDHPNSVQIFDFGEDEETKLLYIAMELLEGANLGDVVRKEKRFTPERSVEIMYQVLAALGAAHRGGVIHRDLKPANIMLVQRYNDDGEVTDFVKVCDFGIAKVLHVEGGSEATALALTRDGAVFGTPAFMSPEQAKGEKVDPRTDLFACGAILYKMLTGTVPFRATTAPEMMAKLIGAEPDPVTSHLPELDPRLANVVHKSLLKDRAQRFQTAQEMRAALKEAMGARPRPEELAEKTIFDPRPPEVDRTAPPPATIKLERTAPPAAKLEQGTLGATRRPLGAPVAVIDRVGPPKKSASPGSVAAIFAVVIVLGGLAWLALKKDHVTGLAELVGAQSYGIAENYFLDHYEALSGRPEAAALVREALRLRREAENYPQKSGLEWDGSYRLEPSSWAGETSFEEPGVIHTFLMTIDKVGEASFEGTLRWPQRNLRSAFRGLHHGNELVFWDYELLDGQDPKKHNYVLLQKIHMMIREDRMLATEVTPPDRFEAKRVQ